MDSYVGASASETLPKLMFGFDLRMPWDLFHNSFATQDLSSCQDAIEYLKYAAMQMKGYYDRRHQPKYFAVGDKFLLRIGRDYNISINDTVSHKLCQQYVGPFAVIERVGHLPYRLQFPPRWKIYPVISVQNLEPALSPEPFDAPTTI
ncbi:hypothetical protein N7453_005335 [Penicillium expansum]|nr:hypothetical protein N7453_005335 [Penicillium expansum]